MTVWFTSDLHLGHRLVARLRGFEAADDHDATLTERWTSQVRSSDQVWVLGDLAASTPGRALDLIASLPGQKHLIAGNHDRCHPMYRDAHNWQRRYLAVFESVSTMARRRIDGVEVLLSHFPYSGDHTDEPRHMQYRLRNEGRWLLHGHIHSGVRVDGQQIHVGVDAWNMSPVALGDVSGIIGASSEEFSSTERSTE